MTTMTLSQSTQDAIKVAREQGRSTSKRRNTVIDDNASINLAPGSSTTIIGGTDTVNVGSGSTLTLTGNNNAPILTASNLLI